MNHFKSLVLILMLSVVAGCTNSPQADPDGGVCLIPSGEVRDPGDALGLLVAPDFNPDCQFNHPVGAYWPNGCEGPECAFCELASQAFHNRQHELGCCQPFTCSYVPGRTVEDAARTFAAATNCAQLSIAAHNP
jgi:hypothetical protein